MKLRNGKQILKTQSIENISIDILIKACEKYIIDGYEKEQYINTYKDITHYNELFINFLNNYQSTNNMFLFLKQHIEPSIQLYMKYSLLYNVSIHKLMTIPYETLLDTLNQMKILNQYLSTYILNKFY